MRVAFRPRRLLVAFCGVTLIVVGPAGASPSPRADPASTGDVLDQGFADPPANARPRVWWHWMNGNVTREGIRLDMEWMKRVGVAGLQNFDINLGTPQVVAHPLAYMTPEWKDTFRYTAQLADSLGLELGIASSPGWSESGGPWVQPSQAMKKLVWSETPVEGGRPFRGFLRRPPSVTGPFQNIPMGVNPLDTTASTPPTFYGDTAVIAYRSPHDDVALPAPRVTASFESKNLGVLTDGDLTTGLSVPLDDKSPSWVRFEFNEPRTIRSAVLGLPGGAAVFGAAAFRARLQIEDGAGGFRDVAEITPLGSRSTVTFAPVTGKVFRIAFARIATSIPDWLAPRPGVEMGMWGAMIGGANAPTATISELDLLPVSRVNANELKAGFAVARDYGAIPAVAASPGSAVDPRDVIDLTSLMKPDGTLDWTPPAGRWVILRLGYSLLGTLNHPASAAGTGLEVDKLNSGDVHAYIEHYLDLYSDILGPDLIGAHGLRAVVSDSTEVGPQNWTDDILDQFKTLRGYDPRPWLPVLTGVVVGDAGRSDRFLWDFRTTLAQLTATAHYATIAKATRARGLIQYGEALESIRPSLGDDMSMRRYTTIPMSAMWSFPPTARPQGELVGDDRGAASVAHVYGQNLAAAESMTSAFQPWNFAPRDLRPIIDEEFALGINRPVVHTSVHQPLINKPPGLSLQIFGQYFNRNDTWAELARPWVDYISRSAFLLQQGRFVADVAYFYGEETPINVQQADGRLADAPSGSGFDYVNADAVLELLRVSRGLIETPSGMTYRVLYLGGDSARISLPLLRRIAELVREGAMVVGKQPEGSPSLADDTGEYRQLVQTLWGEDGKGARVGSGRVLGEGGLEASLATLGITPDFSYSKPHVDTTLQFVHRTMPGAEIYFVDNRTDRQERLAATFRTVGRAAEIWRADTGSQEMASYRIEGDHTTVPLALQPFESLFVVFRKPATAMAYVAPTTERTTLTTLGGPWQVAFQPDRGAPPGKAFDRLTAWNDDGDPGVKYFSGTGTYHKTVEMPQTWFRPSRRLILDLGDVRDLAEVTVNGVSEGVYWCPSYRVDVTNALRPGKNEISIAVTNTWVNRLIGDRQPGAPKITFTLDPPYKADAPLRVSGLLGPVSLVAESRRP